jgi:hypothetical protein
MRIKDVSSALALFKEAAVIHGEATKSGEYKLGNKNYYIIVKAIDYLIKENAIDHLLQFLEDPNASVCKWAAAYLLPIHEKIALNALQSIAKEKGIIAGNARVTIQEWEKGNLKNIRAVYA